MRDALGYSTALSSLGVAGGVRPSRGLQLLFVSRAGGMLARPSFEWIPTVDPSLRFLRTQSSGSGGSATRAAAEDGRTQFAP